MKHTPSTPAPVVHKLPVDPDDKITFALVTAVAFMLPDGYGAEFKSLSVYPDGRLVANTATADFRFQSHNFRYTVRPSSVRVRSRHTSKVIHF